MSSGMFQAIKSSAQQPEEYFFGIWATKAGRIEVTAEELQQAGVWCKQVMSNLLSLRQNSSIARRELFLDVERILVSIQISLMKIDSQI